MKLISFSLNTEPRLGAVIDETVIDLSQACAEFQQQVSDLSLSQNDIPTDIVTFLQCDEPIWQAGKDVIAWVKASNFNPAATPFLHPIADVTINPPIQTPPKIVCVGLNYADHCREQNWDIPTSPILFAKFPTSISGYGDVITWTADSSEQVDYEAELAVVICKPARQVSAEAAYDFVGGYMIANDVSARDVQFADKQWTRGKSFDTFCPIGPVLVTHDEIGDPHQLAVKCWVNGELRQDSNTNQLVFKIPELIAFITKNITLLPGDIICTGTPGGVGVFREPPTFLQPGDLVEIEIDQLGRLKNRVA